MVHRAGSAAAEVLLLGAPRDGAQVRITPGRGVEVMMDSESRYRAVEVRPGASDLWVRLADGREVSIAYDHFPRLAMATPDERAHWELIGNGTGIHWPDVDEDVSIYSIVHPELTMPGREPHQGDPAPCRICGQPGRWIHPRPSVDAGWLEPRCAVHTPEDDYT